MTSPGDGYTLQIIDMRRALSSCFALAVSLQGRSAQATPSSTELSLAASAAFWLPSDYHETLRAFDRDPASVGGMLDLRLLRALGPSSRLGGRIGWATTGAAPAAGNASGFDANAGLRFHLFDAAFVYRYVWLSSPRGSGLRVHLDGEVGLVLGSVSMRGVTDRWVAPRLGAAVFLGRQWTEKSCYFGMRAGVQYAPWDGAGGSGFDPVFGAVHLGLEGGILP